MIVFGSQLFGGTDTVPGVFSVATKFFHVQFFPLVPVSSYLILKRNFGFSSFQGIEIPLNGKSIILAYVRALATVAVLGTFIGTVMNIPGNNQVSPNLFGLALGCFLATLCVACALMWHKSTRNASYERATELNRTIGSQLGPQAATLCQRLIDTHYGRVMLVTVTKEDEHDDDGGPESKEFGLELTNNETDAETDAQSESATKSDLPGLV